MIRGERERAPPWLARSGRALVDPYATREFRFSRNSRSPNDARHTSGVSRNERGKRDRNICLSPRTETNMRRRVRAEVATARERGGGMRINGWNAVPPGPLSCLKASRFRTARSRYYCYDRDFGVSGMSLFREGSAERGETPLSRLPILIPSIVYTEARA